MKNKFIVVTKSSIIIRNVNKFFFPNLFGKFVEGILFFHATEIYFSS